MQKSHSSEWKSFQLMVIRYKGLTSGDADRVALREQMARHLMGVFMACCADDEQLQNGAKLGRRDSQLEKLFRQELSRHQKSTLPNTHGGVNEFVPVAAQAFVLERQLRAPRHATFMSSIFHGWNGSGSLEGFMRQCVRNFLADMANSRNPAQRQAGPRIPKDTDADEAARMKKRYEELQILRRGDAAPLEEMSCAELIDASNPSQDGDLLIDFKPGDMYDAGTETVENLRAVMHELAESADVTPLEKAIIGQLMGWDEEMSWKDLAARFGVSAARVSQRKTAIEKRVAALLL